MIGTPSRPSTRRAVKLAGGTLAAALLLSACGSVHPGSAAVVGSDTISASQADTTALAVCAADSASQPSGVPARTELRRALSLLVQTTLARAQAKLTEQSEHDWNRRVVLVFVAFAWLLTIASWPVFQFVSARVGSLLGPQFSPTWISFAAFTALGWLAGGVAAVMLGIQQRGERRLA